MRAKTNEDYRAPEMPAENAVPEASVAQVAERRIHLDFLDGIRALAALYVALGHCSVNLQFHLTSNTLQLSGALAKLQSLAFFFVFRFGQYAVDVFIVLSGFCLMLPVARNRSDSLPKGIFDYFKRRAKRILPPYYAALVFSLLIPLLVRPLQHSNGYWSETTPAYSIGSVLSHLLLLHNWTPYIWKINTPLWSIAVEWQIYFLFPLFLWLKRKRGASTLLLVALVVGVAPHYMNAGRSDATYPWMLSLFALGMVAAHVCFTKYEKTVKRREKFAWVSWAAFLCAVIVVFSTLGNARFAKMKSTRAFHDLLAAHGWCIDVLVGLVAVFIIIHCVECGKSERRSLIKKILENHLLVKIGAFSYSLYLTHTIVIALLDTIGQTLHFPPALIVFSAYFLTVPLCIPIAYGFHLLFERPFMSSFLKSNTQTDSRR